MSQIKLDWIECLQTEMTIVVATTTEAVVHTRRAPINCMAANVCATTDTAVMDLHAKVRIKSN